MRDTLPKLLVAIGLAMCVGCIVQPPRCRHHHHGYHHQHAPHALRYDEPQHPIVNVDGSVSLMPHSTLNTWIHGATSPAPQGE